jgi:hypothetical protein
MKPHTAARVTGTTETRAMKLVPTLLDGAFVTELYKREDERSNVYS